MKNTLITIIDYNAGNTGSVVNCLKRIGVKYQISSDPLVLKQAEKLIFPGVGRARSAMSELKKREIIKVIKNYKKPFLGICLGMQLLMKSSAEDQVKCLGVIRGKVKKFSSKNRLSIPQIGWNQVKKIANDPLFKNIPDNAYFYFVNSYFIDPKEGSILGVTNFGDEFTSVVKKNNFYGVQFHPEKSGTIGQQLVKNFCQLKTGSNLSKRIIACMDIKNGQVVKGINYKNLKRTGDPVKLAKKYSKDGVDELIFLDITATIEKRKTLTNLVKKVAQEINIPFTVGGGINNLTQINELLSAGADKISIGTAAILNPNLIKSASKKFGSQCIVISLDPKKDGNQWSLYINGGSKNAKINAINFAKKMEQLGAGELLVNSLDRDGTKLGYDLDLLKEIKSKVNIPIIASSGAGCKKDFLDAFQNSKVDATLAAGLFNSGKLEISTLKKYLIQNNLTMRINV